MTPAGTIGYDTVWNRGVISSIFQYYKVLPTVFASAALSQRSRKGKEEDRLDIHWPPAEEKPVSSASNDYYGDNWPLYWIEDECKTKSLNAPFTYTPEEEGSGFEASGDGGLCECKTSIDYDL